MEPQTNGNGSVICHQCDAEYSRIGYHWSRGSCDFPEISEYKQGLLTGVMMGDGTLRTHTKNPFIQIYMINRPLLEWLNDELGWLMTGVSLYRTAERSAELNDSDPSNYHDVYVTQTRTLPSLRLYEDWYNGSGKRFPSYLHLSKPVAKAWYACDGSLVWDKRYPNARPHITIGITGKAENVESVRGMFDEISADVTPQFDGSTIRFGVDDTERFLDWLGEPPRGAEYKWHLDNLETYNTLRERTFETEL